MANYFIFLQSEHQRITIFRILCIVDTIFACSWMLLMCCLYTIEVAAIDFEMINNMNYPGLEIAEHIKNYATVIFLWKAMRTAWSFYSCVCVNSLYLQIKDDQLPMSSKERFAKNQDQIPLVKVPLY